MLGFLTLRAIIRKLADEQQADNTRRRAAHNRATAIVLIGAFALVVLLLVFRDHP